MSLPRILRGVALVAVPAPVIAGAMLLSSWAHFDPHEGAAKNEIFSSSVWSVTGQFAASRSRCDSDLDDACRMASERLRDRLGDACHVIARSPFVVGGDLQPSELAEVCEQTIRPAMGAMYAEYFTKRPDQPIEVLLFSNEPTYRAYSQSLSGQSRMSIYGYYRPSSRTVVINLAAGRGTIAHELTHALIDFDCPDLPIWLNEGLASLHEHCRMDETAGRLQITPLVNWRLTVLQQAIQEQTMRPTRELMLLDQLVGQNEALNYAHARYFCMYLNELGLLDDLYRLVRDQPTTDNGRDALQSLMSELSGYGLDADFQRWAMRLVSP